MHYERGKGEKDEWARSRERRVVRERRRAKKEILNEWVKFCRVGADVEWVGGWQVDICEERRRQPRDHRLVSGRPQMECAFFWLWKMERRVPPSLQLCDSLSIKKILFLHTLILIHTTQKSRAAAVLSELATLLHSPRLVFMSTCYALLLLCSLLRLLTQLRCCWMTCAYKKTCYIIIMPICFASKACPRKKRMHSFLLLVF